MTKDIAKVHRVTQSTVTKLISKAKRKPKFVEELFAIDNIKEQKQDVVDEVLRDMTA